MIFFPPPAPPSGYEYTVMQVTKERGIFYTNDHARRKNKLDNFLQKKAVENF